MSSVSRRAAIAAAAGAGALAQVCAAQSSVSAGKPRHYVLVHGAWHGGWAWSRTAPLLLESGHSVSAPTLSGLGERAHVGAGTSGLQAHVQDIVSHLFMEDLRDVVLVGHSYAGCVVCGVLAARTGRVAHAVYVDALVPMEGQSLATFVPPAVREQYQKLADQNATVPPRPSSDWGTMWGLTDPALVAFAEPRIKPQAALSFVEAVQGNPMAEPARRSYLKCARNPNPLFKTIGAGIQKDSRYAYAEVDGHHDVMLIDPPRFAAALQALG